MPAPKKNVAFSFMLPLVDSTNRPAFKANPTLAAGDFKHSGDGSALANLASLPATDPASSRLVKISLSQSEMNYDRVTIQCVDAAGSEWDEVIVCIDTTAVTVDDLVRSTTPANTLDVSAGGEAGIDWANVGSPTTVVNLSGTTVKTATDVETDTQDIQARLPAALTAGGNMKSDALAVSGDATAADNLEAAYDGTGYAHTGNTYPWTAAWDAEVQSEVQDAIEANHLDHLLAVAADGTECANSTYWARLVSKSATPAFSSFVNTTDSLEAIRDRGDAAWITATGFSTHSAADVWASATRTLTAATNITSTGGTITVTSGGVTLADGVTHGGTTAKLQLGTSGSSPPLTISNSGSGAAVSISTTAGSGAGVAIATNGGAGVDISTSTNQHGINISTAGTGIGIRTTSITVTGAMTVTTNSIAWNSAWDAEVQSEVDDALQALGYTATVAGRIDVAVSTRLATAGYAAPLDAAGVRTAVGLAAANLDTQLDALPTAAENAAALLAAGDVDGYTLEQTLKLCLAALAGKLSGAATTTITIRAADDSKDRITATVDSDGNRSAVVLDGAG